MDKDTILAAIDQAFGDLPRPKTMVRNPNHCDECSDHEAVMQAVTPQTITLKEIGNIGWDPVCYLTDEAFCYFMLGFARIALAKPGSYLFQFFLHLNYEPSSRIDAFNREQRRAVKQLVDYIGETMPDKVTANMIDDEWKQV